MAKKKDFNVSTEIDALALVTKEMLSHEIEGLSYCSTICDVLSHRASLTGNVVAFVGLTGGLDKPVEITYANAYQKAVRISKAILSLTTNSDKILIIQEPGLDYISSFFGVLMAGATAIPTFPPVGSRALERIGLLIKDSGLKVILIKTCESKIVKKLQQKLANLDLFWLESEGLDSDNTDSNDNTGLPMVHPDSIALLQYTSGSTSDPKGVVITHRNLMENCKEQLLWMGGERLRIGCTWLPPYHDMGLMGGIVMPIFAGFKTYIMTPAQFVGNPLSWLAVMTRYRVTTTIVPNFALDLCLDATQPEHLEHLELSSLTELYCGSEPVRKSTTDRFCAVFGQTGFDQRALAACYGLAEATLFVCGNQSMVEPQFYLNVSTKYLSDGKVVLANPSENESVSIASCGRTFENVSVKIVDPRSKKEVPDRNVGELWIAGPNVANGYLNSQELNNQVFHLFLDGDQRCYHRTGDLGFVYNQRIFISGRLKDLIIINGKNIYPNDVEQLAAEIYSGIDPNSIAAFSIEDGKSEQLIVIAGAKRRLRMDKRTTEEVTKKLDQRITAVFGVKPGFIGIVPALQLPKTTSGKVQRRLCREMYFNDLFKFLD
ncbi:fatty acyl-AMP ligase [Reinekea sp.]|jgi:acyl-CoA synthetase (AMP-forming)/AMP-acid ligase II|uniref:fatty acyl-AMP ligase n=1 Tax=Reinekea sp. TaxID=1970455 RepID=UPI002A81E17A|nr:fatty acyl-AMP ligase [Reinekea sp.]